MIKKATLIFCTFLLFVLSSCGEYELLEHQNACKRKADSTFRAEAKQLSKLTDSLCEVNFENYRQAALDSLIPARKAAVEKLFSK